MRRRRRRTLEAGKEEKAQRTHYPGCAGGAAGRGGCAAHPCIRAAGRGKGQRETVSQQLQEQKKENSDLESDLSKADDKEFIKGLAKDQLGLAEDGERIFYDVNH